MVGMRISERHKFVFVSTPKAATMSMYWVLRHTLDPKLRRKGMHGSIVPERYLDYFTWTVVRNPYTRAISAWWHMTGSGSKRPCGKPHCPPVPDNQPFDEYIEWLTAEERFPTPTGPGKAHAESQGWRFKRFRQDQVLRYESLWEEFFTLPFVKKAKPTLQKIPRRNTRKHHQNIGLRTFPEGKLYTKELADKVYEWERAIFEQYDYDRDSWQEL